MQCSILPSCLFKIEPERRYVRVSHGFNRRGERQFVGYRKPWIEIHGYLQWSLRDPSRRVQISLPFAPTSCYFANSLVPGLKCGQALLYFTGVRWR
jgi:hypothetical protein